VRPFDPLFHQHPELCAVAVDRAAPVYVPGGLVPVDCDPDDVATYFEPKRVGLPLTLMIMNTYIYD
jgi:hypothetical protein